MLAAQQNTNKRSYNCFLCRHMKYFWWTLFQSGNRSRVTSIYFLKSMNFFSTHCWFILHCCFSLPLPWQRWWPPAQLVPLYFPSSAAQPAVPDSHNISAHCFYWRVPCKGPLWSNSLSPFVLPPWTLSTPPVRCKEVEVEEDEEIHRKTKGSHNFECIHNSKSKNLQSNQLKNTSKVTE